jgi:hypothetical protein
MRPGWLSVARLLLQGAIVVMGDDEHVTVDNISGEMECEHVE